MSKSKQGWIRSWSFGRLEFEIEWIPGGRYYSFWFCLATPKKWGEERGLL